eukprot:TRINITY_DN25528_c0_g1_i4.p1 TRINITY_DN25528_c0_g1~~TRINITY_DN25528_c0_g1_i4.p1  ORF type:complete len:433 (+),score=70.75 TRINITY_DN25528_c0_g1_i4:1010-2308(+)
MNTIGSVASYGPIENMARHGDVVLVAMNYRLNVFGYLALEELSAVDPRGISGNYGLTDQQLALRWVRDNIRKFRGDPGRVTIMGQSSGGTNVFAHLASPTSQGLFQRAIALSGSSNITMDQATKEAQDRRMILANTPCGDTEFGAAHLGSVRRSNMILDCLYNMSAYDLYNAMDTSYSNFDVLYDYPTNLQGLSSRVSALVHADGVTVGSPLLSALRLGLNDVPLMMQTLQAEMACYPVPKLQGKPFTRRDLLKFLHTKFDKTYGANMTEQLFKHYSNIAEAFSPEFVIYAVDADSAAGCGMRALALAAAQGFTSPVYWSLVVAQPAAPIEGQKFAFHNYDVLSAVGDWKSYKPTAEDLRFGEMMLHQWLEFARHGNMSRHAGWVPVQSAEDGDVPCAVIEKDNIWAAHRFKEDVCDFYTSWGIDQKWWWIN